VVPVVYTYLDDFGAWCGVWANKLFSKPDDAPVAHTTHVPARVKPDAPPAGAAAPAPATSAMLQRPTSH
jgi:hypothetical protein